jgi:hypothetical protein
MINRSPEGSSSGLAGGKEKLALARKPVLILALGRGRVGKTVFLSTVAQYYRAAGATCLQIWNIDHHNQSESLNQIFSDVRRPEFTGDQETLEWLEARITEQSQQQFDVVLDVGGNDTKIKRLAQDVNLDRLLDRRGIRPVAVHVLGPDAADLDYLRQISTDNLFMPAATLLVLNSGLTQGRSVSAAFDQIIKDPAVLDAGRRGAKIVKMPELTCMRGVIVRHLTFRAAADGGPYTTSHEPLSLFDQERVAVWWEEKMASFFDSLPAGWMPSLPSEVT